ncbi:hypothetical protein IMCC3317_01660 [Kordia antarctica]|uniref:Lipoprotein n=1 Tax=Kordia antarctica TaxID=1218801 RepID=A0A7L4ZDA5_9FLAO|nr:hypothetical protein [Kordia antarctica]QHI34822.1 hypothetical protein IMCC3317_01660 [Kordia antarctica]
MKHTKIFTFIFFSIILISCKNYYNDTLAWANNIESGTTIENVQKLQPDYIEIDWEDPRTFENEKWYFITKIKGNYDVLGMSNYLVFIDDKYQGREARK